MSAHPIATLSASPPRRFFGVFVLGLLGALLVYLALTMPFSGPQMLVLATGVFALFATMRLNNATKTSLILTETELRTSTGTVLTTVANMAAVERGAFAFKPSNGFLLRLKQPAPRRWVPGMYWGYGTRLGVGGVTGAPQSKGMAELISSMIAAQTPADQ